jgi:hypothetical protein
MNEKRQLKRELNAVKVANNKLKKHLESKMKDHEKEKEILLNRNQELQNELKAIKVSVANMHQVYSIIRSYYLWRARGSSECELSACPGASGMRFKAILVRII